MNVAFINENTLGHASYLMPFMRRLQDCKDLDVTPHLINATPLPDHLSFRAHFSVRGLRKWGLDFQNSRWRMTVSQFVRSELERLRAQHRIDAVVVNTQSIALELADLDRAVPLFVCLDATFEELSTSAWFAPNLGTRIFLPVTAATLRNRERRLFERADRLLAWSDRARKSLIDHYRCPPEKACILPPSIQTATGTAPHTLRDRPQILFVGADFRRKGGLLLLDCYRRWFRDTCDLHVVTQSAIPAEPGVYVHRGVQAYSEQWHERWQNADVFVFPSKLETFGIVLLEAQSFGVPVISTEAGAAREILANGRAGWLLEDRTPETLARALHDVLENPDEVRRRTIEARKGLLSRYDLGPNTEQLAEWLHAAVSPQRTASVARV